MDLKTLLDYGCGLEMQAKGIEEQEKWARVTEVQTVKEGKRPPETKKCYGCGENYPHKRRPCRAQNETCKHCHKKGHFAKVCRSIPATKKVNTVEVNNGDDSTDEYTYHITLHFMQDKIQPLNEVNIEGKTVKCLIDLGAGVNVIDPCSFNQLKNIDITPTSKGFMVIDLLSLCRLLESSKPKSNQEWPASWLSGNSVLLMTVMEI